MQAGDTIVTSVADVTLLSDTIVTSYRRAALGAGAWRLTASAGRR